MSKPAAALPTKAAPVLEEPEVAVMGGGAMLARAPHWWGRLWQRVAWTFEVITREQFQSACLAAHGHIDGMAIEPHAAARKAQRMVAAATDATATAVVAKCDVSDTAVLVIYLGVPKAGFWFSRALALKDPKGGKRG